MRDMYHTWPCSCQRAEGWGGRRTSAVFLLLPAQPPSGQALGLACPSLAWRG